MLDQNKICSDKCQKSFNKKYPLIGDCLFCGKAFHKKKSFTKFCGYACKRHYNEDKIIPKEYICSFCGKDFSSTSCKKGKNIFCSTECFHDFCIISEKEKTKTCEFCKKDFIRNYKQQRFCCKDCQHQWQSQGRKRSKVLNKKTGIENKTQEMLKDMKIKSDYNRRFSFYEIDLYLSEYKLGIEIMGRYWHCDTRHYKKISSMQKESILRDKRKNTFIKNAYNYKILYLWEDEINNNYEVCMSLIKEYINNKGVLSNYHSFNYEIIQGNLLLKKDITIPYMDFSFKKLKKYFI